MPLRTPNALSVTRAPGQVDSEGCAGALLHPDPAVVGFDHRLRDCQTESRTTLFTERHKRLENAIAHLRGHTRTIVLDGNLQRFTFIPEAQVNLPVPAHGFKGILEQIS
jgi:hypothetical protein